MIPVNVEQRLQETGQYICVREINCELLQKPDATANWQIEAKFGESLQIKLVEVTVVKDPCWVETCVPGEQNLQVNGQ